MRADARELSPGDTVTLRDVARAAGVSTASASRALARAGAVSAELHTRILAAARRLGYVPNLAARTLVTRRSGLVGIVTDALADPLIAAVVTVCERRLGEAGYGVLLTSAGSAEQAALAVHALMGRGAQALILAEVGASAEVGRVMESHRVPWVEFAEHPGPPGAVSLSLGRRQGAVLAARYLHALGHRRFGVLATPDSNVGLVVRQALTAACEVELSTTGEGPNAQAALRQWLERSEPPTAIICASDLQALGALRECVIRNIPVPQRLSLIGFGDAEFARWSYPALSTIRVATAEAGARIAQAVLAILEGSEPPAADLAIKLIARESTGAAPGWVATMNVSRETKRIVPRET